LAKESGMIQPLRCASKLGSIVVAAMVAVSFSFWPPPRLPGWEADSAAWLNKQNIWVYGKPPIEYLRTVGATGVTWSVYTDGLNADELAYVESLHASGFRVSSNLSTLGGNTRDETLLKNARCRDIHYKPSSFSQGYAFMCHNNLNWQDHLLQFLKDHIDGKVDGVHLDELGCIKGDLSSGFCDSCMDMFNAHLKGNFSASELKSRFGISNINSFNYRTYLLAHNPGNIGDDPNPYLMTEYFRAQCSSWFQFVKRFLRFGRNYAQNRVLFSGNQFGLFPNYQIHIPSLDFVVFENRLRDLPQSKHVATYLLAEGLAPDKPFVGFPDMSALATVTDEDWPLFQHWMTEAFACGASFLIPYQAISDSDPYTLPAEKISPISAFLIRNRDLYQGVSRPAQIGVFYDMHSVVLNETILDADTVWLDYLSIGTQLQEAHVPFKVLYRGDPVFYKKSVTISDLRRYAAVVIPRSTMIDSATQALLDRFQAGGGNIIKMDELPPGSTVVAELKKARVDVGLSTNASKDMGIIIAKRGSDPIFHFINYKYSYIRRRFSTLRNIVVKATIPAGTDIAGKKLYLFRPESDDKISIRHSFINGKVTFTVPEVDIYAVAAFR
jgi:hypothetical protein